MFESYDVPITLTFVVMVSAMNANSDCPLECVCDHVDETLNLRCRGKIPDTLPFNTRVVNMTDLNYTYLEQSHFNHTGWTNVNKLYLLGGNVERVFSYTFWNVRNLTHLQISFPNLYRIDNNALTHLRLLRTLDLSGNFLLSFDLVVDALRVTDFTDNLDELNLQHMARFLSPLDLGETFFRSLQRFGIKRLDLSHSNFMKVDLGGISLLGASLEELRMVDLDLNSLVFSFSKIYRQNMLPNLKLVDVSFSRMTWLVLSLNLRHAVGMYNCFFPPFQANITKINNILSEPTTQQDVFYQSLNCNRDVRGRLEIKNNNIRILNITVDPNMPMYHEIDLSNNGLEYLSLNLTSHVTILKWISLTQNNLGAMEKYTEFVDLFSHNLDLAYIDLSFNKLNNLPEDFFLNNRKLKTIILSNNLFTGQLFRFEHLKELEYFDISNNRILFLDTFVLRALDSLSVETESNHSHIGQFSVNLTGNIFKCECETKSFIQWILTTQLTLVDKESYICEMQQKATQINANSLRDTEQMCERTKIIIVATLSSVFSTIIIVIVGIFLICSYRRCLKVRHIQFLIEKYRKEDPPNKHLVFLSFCSRDQDFVYKYIIDKLKDTLSERLGASKDDIVCIGDSHFEPGKYILEEIIRCTESCCVVMLIVSEAFCKSHYCDFEALCAELEKKPIILMFLEEVNPLFMSKIMYKHFQRYTRVRWTRRGDELELVPSWDKVCDSICAIAGADALFANKVRNV